jgi:hypothetical protein
LKKSFFWLTVVPIFTRDHERRMYSWIAALKPEKGFRLATYAIWYYLERRQYVRDQAANAQQQT